MIWHIIPNTQLAQMSFDEIFDLTAGAAGVFWCSYKNTSWLVADVLTITQQNISWRRTGLDLDASITVAPPQKDGLSKAVKIVWCDGRIEWQS